MEVQNLRIGNYIQAKYYDEDDNEAIELCRVVTLDSVGAAEYPICVESLGSSGREHYIEFEPVPITEDWLIRFGFEKSKGNFSIDFNLGYLELEYHVIMDLWEFNIVNVGDSWDDPVSMPLKSPQFIHQLQNLYFSLTGEELVLTDK